MITLLEATELTGKSRSTLTRAIRSGKITAKRDDDGKTYLLDPAELARVFTVDVANHDAPNPTESANQTHQPVNQPQVQPATSGESDEPVATQMVNHDELVAGWKRAFEAAESRADDLAATVDDLQGRLDNSERERQRLSSTITALLPAPNETSGQAAPPPETQAPAGFWSRVFGW